MQPSSAPGSKPQLPAMQRGDQRQTTNQGEVLKGHPGQPAAGPGRATLAPGPPGGRAPVTAAAAASSALRPGGGKGRGTGAGQGRTLGAGRGAGGFSYDEELAAALQVMVKRARGNR